MCISVQKWIPLSFPSPVQVVSYPSLYPSPEPETWESFQMSSSPSPAPQPVICKVLSSPSHCCHQSCAFVASPLYLLFRLSPSPSLPASNYLPPVTTNPMQSSPFLRRSGATICLQETVQTKALKNHQTWFLSIWPDSHFSTHPTRPVSAFPAACSFAHLSPPVTLKPSTL